MEMCSGVQQADRGVSIVREKRADREVKAMPEFDSSFAADGLVAAIPALAFRQ
jgi:hypothetical protein